jgi:hypothetical protein
MVILALLSKIALHLLAMDGDKTPWRASAKVTLTLPFPDAFLDVPVLFHEVRVRSLRNGARVAPHL